MGDAFVAPPHATRTPTVNEADRLVALRSYAILDSETEGAFRDLVQLAALLCGTPMSAISLVDAHRQWFKASVGLDVTETPRDVSFCGHAIHGAELMIVEDARTDARFADNPFVTANPGVRFYAAAPLVTAEGHALGSLCVIDQEARTLNADQRAALARLGRQCMRLLELRLTNKRLQSALCERETAVGALQISEARIQAVTESAHDAIVAADQHGTVVSWNAAAERIFGYCRDEIVGQALTLIMPERYRAAHLRGLARVAVTGESTLVGKAVDLQGLRRDGSIFDLEMSLGTWVSGQARFFSAVLRDMTATRQAAAAVKNERDFTAAVLEATDALIIVVTPDGTITRFNAACERASGYDAADVLGRKFDSLIPPDEAARVGEVLAELTSEKSDRRSESSWLHKDGTRRLISWSTTTLVDDLGVAAHIIGTGIDITDRKRAEEQLAHQAAELRALALRDELTGLSNRRGFILLAEQHLRQAARMRRPALLMFIDLDGMKSINDSLGHKDGDRALRDTAAVLRAAFREADILARLGGDEFVALVCEAEATALPSIRDRIETALRFHNSRAGRPYQLAMSFGSTCYDPFAPQTLDSLLASADSAMYANKLSRRMTYGGSRVKVAAT